jgi:hypothetical protein
MAPNVGQKVIRRQTRASDINIVVDFLIGLNALLVHIGRGKRLRVG